jgi:hypothetical protein
LYDTGETERMDSPPRDDSTTDSPPDGDGRDGGSAPNTDRDPRDRSRGHDATAHPASTPSGTGGAGDPNGSEFDGAGGSEFDDPVGDLLPRPGVDSRWWYWIAAIPLYVVVGAAFVLLFAVVALLGFGIGFDAGFVAAGLLFVAVFVLGLAGLVLTILFPIATYVDARAVAASDASWTPDPLVWGLAALATVVLSAFTLSFVMAVYYLYKRHVAIGTP